MVNDTSCTDLLLTEVSFAALIERSTQNRNNNRTANEGPRFSLVFLSFAGMLFTPAKTWRASLTPFSPASMLLGKLLFSFLPVPNLSYHLSLPLSLTLSLLVSSSFSLLHLPFSPFFWIGSGAFCTISESRAISRGCWSPRLPCFAIISLRLHRWWPLEKTYIYLVDTPFRTLYRIYIHNFFTIWSKVFLRNRMSSPRWQTLIGIRKKEDPWNIPQDLSGVEFVRIEDIKGGAIRNEQRCKISKEDEQRLKNSRNVKRRFVEGTSSDITPLSSFQ